MGQGFSVNARRLAEGSQDITGMGGAAGYAGLASALSGAAEQGAKAFLGLGAACRHVAGGLTATASTYTQTEQDPVSRSENIFRGQL